MSGCLDQFNYNCDVDWDSKRNAVASCISSAMFFIGWWLLIDTAAIYSPVGQWNNVYIIVTVCGTIAMFMVNAVSNSQVRGESMNENILGTKGSRLWLMLGFVLSFASLVAALWIIRIVGLITDAELEVQHSLSKTNVLIRKNYGQTWKIFSLSIGRLFVANYQ
ncbi:Transmembrane protein 50B [Dirofilaria immitis]